MFVKQKHMRAGREALDGVLRLGVFPRIILILLGVISEIWQPLEVHKKHLNESVLFTAHLKNLSGEN